ncbi:MAG: type I-B CRISPR-associated protein Cas5 [Sulfurimonas sp.]|nr:type I-B CRISPR-associated protein Cas5 [Sulfurimonas sp.]
MKAVSFRLSGKTACFRKPDVNQFAYFTYNNIHKPALLGIFGAILGLAGHIQLSNENRRIEEENKSIKKKADKKSLNSGYPEFYEKLKGLKISIVPLAPHGYFSKKIQVFNNSIGYASKEMGGNLIVREQWLENPQWQIMILDDGANEYGKLKEYLMGSKSIFVPYLGKNDHPAKIDEVQELELSSYIDGVKISSLFIEDKCEISKMPPRGELSYFFKEVSPMRLQEEYHFYEYENLIFTNHKIIQSSSDDIYSFEQENYFFM